MIDREKNFLIVGLGMMGGSYGERLSKAGYSVYATDIDPEALEIGRNRGIIRNEGESEEELLGSADYLILALPPSLCVPWVEAHQKKMKKGIILTDILGVKSRFVDEMQNLLEDDRELISMHPMTGKETKGVVHSSGNIFNSSNMLIVPSKKNTPRGIKFAKELSKILDVKNVRIVPLEEHDRVVGYVSHLPHLLAVGLINSCPNKDIVECAGTAFRDFSRIANINESLWGEIFMENRGELIPLIDEYVERLTRLEKAMREEDREALNEELKKSRETMNRFRR